MAVKGQPHRQLMPSAPIVATPGMALLCRRIERRVSLPGALSFPAGKLPQQRAEAGGRQNISKYIRSRVDTIAAYDAGLDFWGYELDKVYFDLMQARFDKHAAQMNLFLEQ